jgi:MFS superfamily sulfate permease-like transporter
VVIAAVIELVDIGALSRLYRIRSNALGQLYGPFARPDFIAAMAALFGVLLFDTLPGLVIGIAVSMTLLLYRASKPNIAVLGRTPEATGRWVDIARAPDATSPAGVVVLRPESGLFFANADAVRRAVLDRVDDQTTAVVLDGESMPFVDVTAATELSKLTDELELRGIRVAFARDVGQVRDIIEVADDDPARRVFPTVEAAVIALTDGP